MSKPYAVQRVGTIEFPVFSGVRCLMMPFVQGDPESVPQAYQAYSDAIEILTIEPGDIGFLTIDESPVRAGTAQRATRATTERAIHTEAGLRPNRAFAWGSPKPTWGGRPYVTLDADVQILIANNVPGSCAVWDATHADTSIDGDLGHVADQYPLSDAILMDSGEVFQIGILTPHESLPVPVNCDRQFLRIVSSGVHGREPYFTRNPLLGGAL